MNDILVRRAKFSTVAIAIRDYTHSKIEVIGSGFFYDTRGYIMSAAHVLRDAQKIQKENEFRKIKSEIVAINNHIRNERLEVVAETIEEILYPNLHTTIETPTAPVVFDVGIAKVKPDREQYPFLKIKNEGELQTGDQVVMCGFPAGNQSLSFEVDAFTGLRSSPVMQFGHISTLLPFDDSLPYGIQTDIVSTGGSSGSPLISVDTGEVIGLAQKIILTFARVDIPEKAQKKIKNLKTLDGFAHIGIIYGDSFNMISDIPNMTKDDFSNPKKPTKTQYSRVFLRKEFQKDGITINFNDL